MPLVCASPFSIEWELKLTCLGLTCKTRLNLPRLVERSSHAEFCQVETLVSRAVQTASTEGIAASCEDLGPRSTRSQLRESIDLFAVRTGKLRIFLPDFRFAEELRM